MSTVGNFLKGIEKGKVDVHYQDGGQVQTVERIPTGYYGLDSGIGGGFPVGRMSLIYGEESSMKTTLCIKAMASAQRMYPDKKPVFIDVEGHFDWGWAQKMGLDIDKALLFQPNSAEQAIDLVCDVLLLEDVSVIVLDSLAALITTEELNKEAAENVMATNARAINRLYRKSSLHMGMARIAGQKPTLLFVNQIRYKMQAHGDPETMPGGPSLKFGSSLTLRLRGVNEIVKSVHPTLPAYRRVFYRIKKNKVPITQGNGDFLSALRAIEEYNLRPGQSYDWPPVLAQLKNLELLTAGEKKGWNLTWPDTGEIDHYAKQTDIKDKMFADSDFALRLKSLLIAEYISREESVVLDNSEEA